MLPYISIGSMRFPMYGICMAIGILLSVSIALIRSKRVNRDFNSLIVIAACAIGSGLLCAKLLYIAVSYGIDKAIQQMAAGDLSFLMDGGQVFYGGLIGGIGGAILGARITRQDLSQYCEAIVPCIPLGHAFGRLGCFFSGCCYGMPYDGIGCLIFPAAGIYHPTFPVQLLEMIINIAISFFLMLYTRTYHRRYFVLYIYLLSYSLLRFVLEFVRGDLIRGVSFGLSTSQWISIVVFAVSALLMLKKDKKEMQRA